MLQPRMFFFLLLLNVVVVVVGVVGVYYLLLFEQLFASFELKRQLNLFREEKQEEKKTNIRILK